MFFEQTGALAGQVREFAGSFRAKCVAQIQIRAGSLQAEWHEFNTHAALRQWLRAALAFSGFHSSRLN